MDSKTALEIVKSIRELVTSKQASKEELELNISKLCTVIEQAVTAITNYQIACQRATELFTFDEQVMLDAIDEIKSLRAQVEILKRSSAPAASNPVVETPTTSKRSIPQRDAKGRFIRFTKQVVTPVRLPKPNSPCETCKAWNICKSLEKQYKE